MFTKIADILMEHDIDVYSIGQHKGECKSAFVVIKDYRPGNTTEKNLKSQVVDIFPFFPLGRYTQALTFIEKIDDILYKELEPVHDAAPIMIDNDKQAYTTKLSYRIIKRRK